MANGELCKKCRHQETQHDHGHPWADPEACGRFVSEFTHHKDCPVLDCGGDCKRTIQKADWAAHCEEHGRSKMWQLNGPDLVIVDVGS